MNKYSNGDMTPKGTKSIINVLTAFDEFSYYLGDEMAHDTVLIQEHNMIINKHTFVTEAHYR